MINKINEYLHFYIRKIKYRKYLQPSWQANGNNYSLLGIKNEVSPIVKTLDVEIKQYLTHSNPFLLQLKKDYSKLNLFEISFWENQSKRITMDNFRGDWNYLSQLENKTDIMKYIFTAEYIENIDKDGLLYKLGEDNLFGAMTFRLNEDLIVSRDLLESVLEITFLKNKLGLEFSSKYNILDIGAGYGRFAYRFAQSFSDSFAYCIDPIAESTFLCDFYLKFRKVEENAITVPLNELDKLSNNKIDIACNIHSWSECTIESIKFWLDLLVDMQVKYLFVVPHEPNFLSQERNGEKIPFLPEIKKHGYKIVVKENNYGNSKLAKHWGIYPAVYALFQFNT